MRHGLWGFVGVVVVGCGVAGCGVAAETPAVESRSAASAEPGVVSAWKLETAIAMNVANPEMPEAFYVKLSNSPTGEPSLCYRAVDRYGPTQGYLSAEAYAEQSNGVWQTPVRLPKTPSDFEYYDLGAGAGCALSWDRRAGTTAVHIVSPAHAYSTMIGSDQENVVHWSRPAPDASWSSPERVGRDAYRNLWWDVSTDVGPDGTLHVLYRQGGTALSLGGIVYYSARKNDQWTQPLALPGGAHPSAFGARTSIVADPRDARVVHAAYVTADRTLTYARISTPTAGSPSATTVAVSDAVYPSLGLDGAGVPHIAMLGFNGEIPPNPKFATIANADAATPTVETVDLDPQFFAGQGATLVFDRDGRAHAAYMSNGGLAYTYQAVPGGAFAPPELVALSSAGAVTTFGSGLPSARPLRWTRNDPAAAAPVSHPEVEFPERAQTSAASSADPFLSDRFDLAVDAHGTVRIAYVDATRRDSVRVIRRDSLRVRIEVDPSEKLASPYIQSPRTSIKLVGKATTSSGTALGPSAVTYTWSAPNGGTLSSSDQPNVTFTAPSQSDTVFRSYPVKLSVAYRTQAGSTLNAEFSVDVRWLPPGALWLPIVL